MSADTMESETSASLRSPTSPNRTSPTTGVTMSRYPTPSCPGTRSKKGANKASRLAAPGCVAAKHAAMLPPCEVPTTSTRSGTPSRPNNSANWSSQRQDAARSSTAAASASSHSSMDRSPSRSIVARSTAQAQPEGIGDFQHSRPSWVAFGRQSLVQAVAAHPDSVGQFAHVL